MKKRINGRTYDTEKAKKIATCFMHGIAGYKGMFNEEFYLKKNGELFFWYNGKIYVRDDWNIFNEDVLDLLKERLKIRNEYSVLQGKGLYVVPFTEVYEDEIISQLTNNK